MNYTSIIPTILFLSSLVWNFSSPSTKSVTEIKKPYLTEKSEIFIPDSEKFISKIDEISKKLNTPSEWLMIVIYSESKFDSRVSNYKGSGAVGLIQFMPETALALGTTTEALKLMTPIEQLDWVYKYMLDCKTRYGEFKTLTDFYLAILYPKAIPQEDCYILYSSPSISYKQNSGLDFNMDKHVSKSDIQHRLMKLHPTINIYNTNLK